MTVSTFDIVTDIKNKLSSITILNGYKTDIGNNVLLNQNSFNFDDDIDKDTINCCDDGITWEKENNYFYRHQNFTLQFYCIPGNDLFEVKIYNVYDDIEKFIIDLTSTALKPSVRVRNPKGQLKFHRDGRDLALIEIELTTTLIIK